LGAPTDRLAQSSEEILKAPFVGSRATANFNDIILIAAAVEGNVFMNGYQKFTAAGLRVTGNMSMQEAKLLDDDDLNMARIGGNLDLRFAHVGPPFIYQVRRSVAIYSLVEKMRPPLGTPGDRYTFAVRISEI
jgi:hypothetical protein